MNINVRYYETASDKLFKPNRDKLAFIIESDVKQHIDEYCKNLDKSSLLIFKHDNLLKVLEDIYANHAKSCKGTECCHECSSKIDDSICKIFKNPTNYDYDKFRFICAFLLICGNELGKVLIDIEREIKEPNENYSCSSTISAELKNE